MVRRPESSQKAEQAVLLVEDILNSANWVANRLYQDYGIDLHVKVFDSGHDRKATPWEFHVQVRGRTRLPVSKGHISIGDVDTGHLQDWYEATLPVLFVVCDVKRKTAFWLWIKKFVDHLGLGWARRRYVTLRIPIGNRFTAESLPGLLADIKRFAFIREANNVIAAVEEGLNEGEEWEYSRQHGPVPDPDPSIRDLALARCLLCENYFWIDEQITAGWDVIEDEVPLNCDFTKIYEPWKHQPSVYSCDSAEEYCPICMNGEGALGACESCGRFRVPLGSWVVDDWDDPTITSDEAERLCPDCLEDLRRRRTGGH